MMEMSIKSILKELAVTAEVDHRDLASRRQQRAEIFVATRDIAEQLVSMGSTVGWYPWTTWSTRPP